MEMKRAEDRPQVRMAKNEQLSVLMFRAGGNGWEESGRIAGSADLPMCDAGQKAVGEEIARLGPASLSLVLCGPDEASIATAEALAAPSGAKVKVIPDLGEVCLGLWEGLTEQALESRCPTTYRQWQDDPWAVSAPEGESLDEAESRVALAIRKAIGRSRPENGAVALVLRPIVMALAGGILKGERAADMWQVIHNGPASERLLVDRSMLDGSFERSRVKT